MKCSRSSSSATHRCARPYTRCAPGTRNLDYADIVTRSAIEVWARAIARRRHATVRMAARPDARGTATVATASEVEVRIDHMAGPTHVVNGGIIAAVVDCHSICTAIADAYRVAARELGSEPLLWCGRRR